MHNFVGNDVRGLEAKSFDIYQHTPCSVYLSVSVSVYVLDDSYMHHVKGGGISREAVVRVDCYSNDCRIP